MQIAALLNELSATPYGTREISDVAQALLNVAICNKYW